MILGPSPPLTFTYTTSVLTSLHYQCIYFHVHEKTLHFTLICSPTFIFSLTITSFSYFNLLFYSNFSLRFLTISGKVLDSPKLTAPFIDYTVFITFYSFIMENNVLTSLLKLLSKDFMS